MHSYRSFLFYLCVMTLVMLVDHWVGQQVSLWVFQLPVICLATWSQGRRSGGVLAVLGAAMLLVVGLVDGHLFTSDLYLYFSVSSKLLAYGVCVWLVAALRTREIERLYMPGKPRAAKATDGTDRGPSSSSFGM